MPLVLALESNRDRAGQLASVARRLDVDFMLSSSIEEALCALDDHVPDLILIPSLLSGREDASLTDRLRELGAAAAHVQTLTIPILGAAEASPAGGMLRALRWRQRRRSAPDACDPEIFAEQIRVYLARAAEAREALPVQGAEAPPALADEPHVEEVRPRLDLLPIVAVEDAWSLPENGVEHDLVEAPGAAGHAAVMTEVQPPEPDALDIDTAVPTAAMPIRIEPVLALAPLPPDDDTWIAVSFDEEPEVEEPTSWRGPADSGADTIWLLTPVPEIELVLAESPAAPALCEADTVDDNVWVLTSPGMEEVAPSPLPEPPDPVTVVLLTPVYDLPSQSTEVAAALPVEVQAGPPEAGSAHTPATTRRRKAGTPAKKPVQDEWSFFDPNQCGFAALLDKLDEITAREGGEEKPEGVTVRVVGY